MSLVLLNELPTCKRVLKPLDHEFNGFQQTWGLAQRRKNSWKRPFGCGPPSKTLSQIKAKGAALKSNEPTGSKTPTWLAVGTLQKAKKGSLAKVTRATEHGRSQIT